MLRLAQKVQRVRPSTQTRSFWSELVAVATVGSVSLGIANYRSVQAFLKHRKYRNNLTAKLSKAYDPDPLGGTYFHRGDWTEKFQSQLREPGYYKLYYGPSQLGKTTSVAEATRGLPAVIQFSLRACEPDLVYDKFVGAINIYGNDQSKEVVLPRREVENLFRQVCRNRKKETLLDKVYQSLGKPVDKTKPLLIVEDIHSVKLDKNSMLSPQLEHLLGFLMDLYRNSLVSVVFTISDVSALDSLQKVSGHSETLKIERFPSIPDDVLIPQLEKEIADRALPHMNRSRDPTEELVDITPATYMVERLGCHMGQINQCLNYLSKDKLPVEVAVKKALGAGVSSIVSFFLSNTHDYVAGTVSIFEALSQDGCNEIHWDAVLSKDLPSLPSKQRYEIVISLVQHNLLSFIGDEKLIVSFHSRSIKWAYLEAKKKPEIQVRLAESRN